MANISRIRTGGDLLSRVGEVAMVADLVGVRKAGITRILDNRIECSEEAFVEAHAPKVDYFWNGQDDAGQHR